MVYSWFNLENSTFLFLPVFFFYCIFKKAPFGCFCCKVLKGKGMRVNKNPFTPTTHNKHYVFLLLWPKAPSHPQQQNSASGMQVITMLKKEHTQPTRSISKLNKNSQAKYTCHSSGNLAHCSSAFGIASALLNSMYASEKRHPFWTAFLGINQRKSSFWDIST